MRLFRFALVLALLASASVAVRAAEGTAVKPSIIGKVQPEIRLTDGTVFKKAKIVSFSVDGTSASRTATISEPTRTRVVALDSLPKGLRDQILTEAGIKPDEPRQRQRRARPAPTTPSAPPPDQTILPEAPVTTPNSPGVPATELDPLLKQAGAAAPAELKFYLTKTFDRVGSLTCKVREVAQMPGWQKIRVTGEASFTQWDARQADQVWRTDKFEVDFAIIEGRSLKAETVSFAGISRAVGER